MGKQKMTWRRFGLSLIDAAINSAASGATVIIVDPVDFNPMGGGLGKLLSVMGVSALFGIFMYLKAHRLPGVEEEEERGV